MIFRTTILLYAIQFVNIHNTDHEQSLLKEIELQTCNEVFWTRCNWDHFAYGLNKGGNLLKFSLFAKKFNFLKIKVLGDYSNPTFTCIREMTVYGIKVN